MSDFFKKQALYLITRSPFRTEDWSHIEAAIKGGVTIVQLRDKNATPQDLLEKGAFLKGRLDSYGIPLIINDHVDVAAELGVGVHLGLEDGCPHSARQILGPEACIGLTVHKWLEYGERFSAVIDYIGCGPIFETQTKADAKAPFGVETLKHLCQASKVPVVAIGGIDSHNAPSVWAARPWAIAVSSAIVQATDPMRAAQGLCAGMP